MSKKRRHLYVLVPISMLLLMVSCGEIPTPIPGQGGATTPLSIPSIPRAPAATPVPEAGTTILLAEDFATAAALVPWTSRFLDNDPGNTATWEVRDGFLHLREGGGMQEAAMVLVTGADWTDYVYSADMYARGNLQMGVVFRYSALGFYRFRFLSGEYSIPHIRLLERVTGDNVEILAADAGPGYDLERWYNVQVVARGDHLRVYLDGAPILEATDSTLPSGQIGTFALSLGGVYFDNVRVTTTH